MLICGALTGWAEAEEVDVDTQYFHPAASRYIQGDTAGASNLVVRGLSEYPNNGKLKRLKELLEQQEQQQNQDQNQEKEQEQDENRDQQNEDQQNQDQQNQEQQNQD